MKVSLRYGEETFEVEGSETFARDCAAMFDRAVLDRRLEECRQRLAEYRKWERALLRGLRRLNSSAGTPEPEP